MTTIGEALDREWATARDRYHDTSPKEAPVSLIDVIEQDLTAAGHVIDATAHGILTRHLALANIAAHVAQGIADAQATPVAQALERAALGPAGEAFAAKLIEDAAAFFQAGAGPGLPQAAALADTEPPSAP